MLRLIVHAEAGASLRNAMADMVAVATRTGCMIEMKGNETTFWVEPGDTLPEVLRAFDRLYPQSTYVATWIKQPAPRAQPNEVDNDQSR